MNGFQWLCAVVALGLVVYLLFALLKAEEF